MTSLCVYYFLRRIFDPSQVPSCSIVIVMMTFSAVIHLSNIFLLISPLSVRAVFALVDFLLHGIHIVSSHASTPFTSLCPLLHVASSA